MSMPDIRSGKRFDAQRRFSVNLILSATARSRRTTYGIATKRLEGDPRGDNPASELLLPPARTGVFRPRLSGHEYLVLPRIVWLRYFGTRGRRRRGRRMCRLTDRGRRNVPDPDTSV